MLRIARGQASVQMKSHQKRREASIEYKKHLSSLNNQSVSQMNIFALRNQFDKQLKQNVWKPAGLSSTGVMTSLLNNNQFLNTSRNGSIENSIENNHNKSTGSTYQGIQTKRNNDLRSVIEIKKTKIIPYKNVQLKKNINHLTKKTACNKWYIPQKHRFQKNGVQNIAKELDKTKAIEQKIINQIKEQNQIQQKSKDNINYRTAKNRINEEDSQDHEASSLKDNFYKRLNKKSHVIPYFKLKKQYREFQPSNNSPVKMQTMKNTLKKQNTSSLSKDVVQIAKMFKNSLKKQNSRLPHYMDEI